ncbi:MAG: hypothetical protein RLZZ450_148 [Pseudomonadota bacterium]
MILKDRSDLRPLFFNGVYFASLLAAWLYVPLNLWALPPLVLLCVTAFQGAVQTHNAIHSPVFKQRWLNKVYQVVLTCVYGHPVSAYVPGHNLSHHRFTQSRRDVMRTTKTRFRWHLLNGLFFMLSVAPGIMRADSEYIWVMRKRHPRWFRQGITELAVLLSIQVALFVLDWKRALLFWLLPHLYAQWGIVTINLLQHDGCDADSEYNHSRNFVGRAVNWLAFNNGFHGIHHDIPGLHWSKLPAAHAARYAGHIHPALDCPSLLAYLWTTFFLNQRLRYDGTPVVLPTEGPDESWLPEPKATLLDLGAETLDPTAS